MVLFGAILRKKIETNHFLEMAYQLPLVFRNLIKDTKFEDSLYNMKQFSIPLTCPVSLIRNSAKRGIIPS
jgi:hypothetical protein